MKEKETQEKWWVIFSIYVVEINQNKKLRYEKHERVNIHLHFTIRRKFKIRHLKWAEVSFRRESSTQAETVQWDNKKNYRNPK